MKKNNVRLICTSVASGDKKNYAVVPVKVKEKRIDYTEDEIKVLAESILNPKTRKQPAYDEPLEDVVVNDAPVEEAQEDTIVAEPIVVEPEVEEAEEAPADEPVYEATEEVEGNCDCGQRSLVAVPACHADCRIVDLHPPGF